MELFLAKYLTKIICRGNTCNTVLNIEIKYRNSTGFEMPGNRIRLHQESHEFSVCMGL